MTSGIAHSDVSRYRAEPDEERTIFYTALYRTMLRIVDVSEGDRYYSIADHQVHPPAATASTWAAASGAVTARCIRSCC